MAKAIYVGAENFQPRTLPAGYTQVEYIQSSGTQYINTGFSPDGNSRIVMDCEPVSQSATYAFFCARVESSGSDPYTNTLFYVNNQYRRDYYGSNQLTTSVESVGKRIIVDCDKGSAKIGSYTLTFTASSTQTTMPWILLASAVPSGSGLTSINNFASMKLYACHIYDNGALVRDYVPCINDGGIVGLYDLIGGTFYGNAGTGVFVAGSGYGSAARKVKKIYLGRENFRPRNLPTGYTQVEYIQSTGTQYINTGFKPNNNTRAVGEFSIDATDVCGLFGSRIAYSQDAWCVFAYGDSARTNFQDSYSTASLFEPPATTGYCKIDKNKNTTNINGYSHTFDPAVYQLDFPMYVMAINTSNGAQVYPGKMKLYSFKVWDNGVLVLDLIPCVSSGGVVGLYDIANGAFYTNAGTGVFTAGAGYGNTARKVKKAYIGVGGVARPCFHEGKLAYYGAITGLNASTYELASVTARDHALFAGGRSSTSVNAYSRSLVRLVPASLPTGLYIASARAGDYALFAGGQNCDTVSAYDRDLVKTTAESLPYQLSYMGGASVGDYALFAGGQVYGNTRVYSTVTAYNKSLVRSLPSGIAARMGVTGASVGSYAIFAGGDDDDSRRSDVEAYSTSLTRVSVTGLSEARNRIGAASVGEYAIFAGGENNSINPSGYIDAYNKSLTRTTLAYGVIYSKDSAGTTLGDYALIAGGLNSADDGISTTSVYDAKLTRTTFNGLSVARGALAAATVGDYALFAGGFTNDNWTIYNTVDAYQF